MGDKWADLGVYGRYIKRTLNLLMKEVKAEEQKALRLKEEYRIDDIEKIVSILNALSRAARTQATLADYADHDKRLANIEKIIELLPQGTLQELKAKMGA